MEQLGAEYKDFLIRRAVILTEHGSNKLWYKRSEGDILSLILGQGFGLALAGVLLGICGALVLTHLLKAWAIQGECH